MIYEKIRQLCDKEKISLPKLEQTLEFGNGTITKWKTSMPSVDKLKKVADHFDVTVDELLKED